jgi:hypothetical protein
MKLTRVMFALIAVLVVRPFAFAQNNKTPGADKSESAAAAGANSALSHDLSGVWMPYSIHMDGIDEKARPPLTPWGQSRFE